MTPASRDILSGRRVVQSDNNADVADSNNDRLVVAEVEIVPPVVSKLAGDLVDPQRADHAGQQASPGIRRPGNGMEMVHFAPVVEVADH